MNNLDKIKKRLIYYVALLTVYFLMTLGLAAIFEYYIVSTTKGEIIFSFAMSWQLILFVLELITIVVQAVTLIKVVNKCTRRRFLIIRNTGIAAGAFAVVTVVYLLISDGICIYPTSIFAVYMLLIVIVRGVLIPKSVKNVLRRRNV